MTGDVQGVDLDVVGVILMVVGVIGLLWGMFASAASPWRRGGDAISSGSAPTTADPSTTAESPTTTASPTTTVAPTTTTTVPPSTTTTTVASTTTTIALSTTTTTVPPSDAHGDILESGDSGPAVAELQAQLEALRYWVGPHDGVFGWLTEQAVYAFQKANDITVDGRGV